jgi:hypothetical protein
MTSAMTSDNMDHTSKVSGSGKSRSPLTSRRAAHAGLLTRAGEEAIRPNLIGPCTTKKHVFTAHQ